MRDQQDNYLNTNSKLGLGFMRHDLNKNNQNIVDFAMSNNIHYFETCYFYLNHQCESYVYSLLQKYNRESYEICGKLSLSEAFRANNTDFKKMYFEQLEKVPGHYFDVYLLQTLRPQTFLQLHDSDLLEFFYQEKVKGHINRFGFSEQCDSQCLEQFLRYDCWDIAQMPLNYYDWYLCESDKNYALIKEHGIPIIAQAPYKGGTLVKDLPVPVELKLADYHRSLSQLALDFVQDKQPEIILAGCSTLSTVMQYEREHAMYRAIDNYDILEQAMNTYRQLKTIPCVLCDKCTKVCPQGIKIPLHIAAYNRALQNKEKFFAGVSLLRYFDQEPINMCLHCQQCQQICPMHLDIPELFMDIFNLKP